MTPGTTTGPGENRENLDRRDGETNNHGEQVRHTRNFCETLRNNDPSFKQYIEELNQGGKTKAQLREEFKKRLKGKNAAERAKMGIISANADVTDTEIEAFLTKTGCFDNQFMSAINSDARAKEKANGNFIDSCLEVAHDEYGNFDEIELKASLKKEGNSRLRIFLENPKYRKTYISRLPGGRALRDKNFSDINFDEITKAIGQLGPTHPKRAEIQEAWLKIARVGHPDSNLATAFYNVSHEGGKSVDLAGAYGAFFGDENTLISRDNREKILNFLVRQYTPIVPLSVLEVIDPLASKKYLTSDIDRAEIERDLPADPELAEALKKDREEQWEKIHKTHIGGGKSMIGSRSLPYETKIKILSQFGSAGKAEKMRDYYKGKPGSLRSSTDTEGSYREKFREKYGLDTEKVDIKAGLTEELIARLGHRVEGMEHFDAGCAMEWKTKNKNGEEITGYYILETVPGDTLDEENIITMRFLGDNKDPLSASGLAHHYTGADFYEYLDGCAEDGKIIFRERESFEEELASNAGQEKMPRYFTPSETQAELRNQFPEVVEVQSFEEFNTEVDQLLNPSSNNPKEAKTPKERELHEGMIFCKTGSGGIDTFQIQDIDKDAGTITLWDGWGTNAKSIIEMPFTDFLRTLKSMKQGNGVHRVPTGGKKITIDTFNTLCSDKEQYDESVQKKIGKLNIREENGHMMFGQFDEKTGNFKALPVVKIGDKKDLYIESIDGTTVTYRVGTFTQGVSNKEKGTWKKKPGFSGSPVLTMSLEMLWAYLQNHQNFVLEKPDEKPEIDEQKEKSKPMSWWNILKHSHSWGVLLHGDLWKAPFKAWEEQHHKDHAFHGKITAALAMEKLQSGKGPISGILNWAEWPTLMVADGNGSLQSYLDELVNKIDGMGSYHRTRLIKKWSSKEHFPSPKFMAAMFASMKIFGQLYPYDWEDSDYKNKDGSHEWVWYNSICHSLDPNHAKYPHMPPHHGEKWPEKWTNKEGYKMNEIDVCFELFGKFEHPMLKNLGRRFQKYMIAGQKELADGGEGNLKQRTTMTEKLDWMMSAAVGPSGKPPEVFGASTELWLSEGYPTHITTMPYAAMLFGHREEQMLSPTREHIKTQFQSGYHIPMFVFMQNKDLGDTFRTTSIAFAYTISDDCGKELEQLTKEAANNRISGRNKKWSSRFQSFWTKHGTELMHKLTGMRDPMLNLMMSDPTLFDKLLEKQPAGKRKQYEMLREKKSVIKLYYERIAKDTYGDSPDHANMKRGEGYYVGDHFRYRKGFETGMPIAWFNWSNYLDPNLTNEFASGSQSRTGDGVFWELKGFLSDIPKLARKIALDMGYSEDDPMVQDIAESLYTKNVTEIKKETQSKLKPENISASYATMFGVMFELVEPKRIKGPGDGPKDTARNEKYFEQMKACLNKAKEIEKGPGGFPAAIEYRTKVAANWEKIVDKVIETEELSLEDIEEGRFNGSVGDLKIKTQARSGTVLQEKKDEHDERARQGKETPSEGRSGAATDNELGL